tara:strand:+ start:2962 stop:3147 length:186 start_codon:yes stop_codon:yes gene_type:complete
MKKSLKSLLDEFKNEDTYVKEFLEEVFIIENEKLNTNHSKWKSDITDKLDKIVEKKAKSIK